jgi:nitrite reductase/ring-hydroxylating ferredoxin subunit
MVKRSGWVVAALLVLVLSAGCAAPATAPQAQQPPDITGEVAPGSPGASPASEAAGDTAAISTPVSGDPLTAGLSSRTTRGHIWAEPVIDGDTVLILHSVATLGSHVNLEVPANGGVAGFIGYFTNDEFCLRATACPNCGAGRIEWGGSLVVCRSCSTTFDLVTGEASGEGRGYPLGTIPYSLEGDTMAMYLGDLVEAYARTASGEETLFEVPEVFEDEDRGDRSWPRCCVVA